MRKFLYLLFISASYLGVEGQSIINVKDTLVQNSSSDSMFYVYEPKIYQFKDSGVVIIGSCDSVLINQQKQLMLMVNAYDKDLKLLWSIPIKCYYANYVAFIDSSYNIYLICSPTNSSTVLHKISSLGNIIFQRNISTQIASNISIESGICSFNNHILLFGEVYYAKNLLAPYLALFDMNGNLYRKVLLPNTTGDLYSCYLLNITPDNNISIAYQNDLNDIYTVACYDSSLSKMWSKTLNFKFGNSKKLMNQGSNIVLINMATNGYATTFKFDAKTGSGGNEVDFTLLSLTGHSSIGLLSTMNGRYINFGNMFINSFTNNVIDYFDDNNAIATANTNAINSRNAVSSACIAGNYIYTVSVRLVDKYCDATYYRGMLWINKFSTDFLSQTLSVREPLSNHNKIELWPNPFSDEIFMNGVNTSNDLKVMIYDQLGNSIQVPQQSTGSLVRFDTGLLAKGIYFVSVSSNGDIKRSKMLKF